MAKKKGGGKKKKGGKKAKEPVDPAILERAMAKMPTTTSWGTLLPPAGARDMTPRGAGREEAGMPPLPKFVVRVNELVQVRRRHTGACCANRIEVALSEWPI